MNIVSSYSAFFFLCEALILFSTKEVNGEFDGQPRIRAEKGSLLIEAPKDRNIIVRVSSDSSLCINEVNILDIIKRNLVGQDGVGQRDTSATEVRLTQMKQELLGVEQWFMKAKNRTRSRMQVRLIGRNLNRLTRITARVSEIEKNLSIDECMQGNETACKNGGECYDGYTDFRCECLQGWTGKTCEQDVDECYTFAGTGLGCQNNADCVNTPGSYRCTCRNGYSGTHCRLKSAICETTPESVELCGHGICVHANNERGYTCVCDQGWTTNGAMPDCSVDVDECSTATNPCHSTCINLPGSYKCGPCPRGYTGDGIMCRDIDECASNNGGCSLQPKVTCINTEGSHHCSQYCPPGWQGDGQTCQKMPSCDNEGICHPRAKCEYISDTAVCTCLPGLYGHGFGANGCSIEPTTDPCAQHQCKNNGTCITAGRGTRCLCALGYIGPMCEQSMACQPNPCNGGICTLLPNNKFRCNCQRGTTGNTCEITRNICGSSIMQESGNILYPPNGNSSYLANERCAWIIRTADTKILNVTFERFDLEDSPECSKDWLQIHDGRTLASQLIGRFCGQSLPLNGNFVSSNQQLFFWFRSDNITHSSGFNLSWHSQEHICGGDLQLGPDALTTILRSPGYPGKAPANRECEWKLSAPYGYRLVFRFYEVLLGGEANCSRDTLKIFDSDSLLRTICESIIPEPIHTSANQAIVHFHTDSVGADSAFQLHAEMVPGTPNCGGLFTESEGTINGYMNSPVCLYLIQQPPGTKVELQITKLNLIASNDCNMQRIEIYDGTSDNDQRIKVLCGEQESLEPFVSESNAMLLRYEYKLVGINLPKMFEANYRRVCNERVFGPGVGIISTPNYPRPYYPGLKCIYDIYGPIDTLVTVNFTDFSITPSVPMENAATDDDSLNYVDVYLSKLSKRRFYKGQPMHLVSQSNQMRIVFNAADNRAQGRGIRFEYAFEDRVCGGVMIASNGSFKIDMAYNYCEWTIEAGAGQYISLNLEYATLGRGQCVADQAGVFIYANSTVDGTGELLESYCALDKHIVGSYHASLLTIIWKRGNSARSVQFLEAQYTLVNGSSSCGGNFTTRFGVIQSPSWPKPYDSDMNCVWIISAPLGNQIELRIQSFDLEAYRGDCIGDWLLVRNGKYDNSPLIGKYCGTSIPSRIPSYGNYLYLQFSSDATVSGGGFNITWEQTATGCGGILNSNIGSIHSPHLYDLDDVVISCDWQINIAEGSSIDINLSFDDSPMSYCNSDIFAIYDGPSSGSRRIDLNCSEDSSGLSVKTSTNQALVRYTTNILRDGLRFMLDYRTNCQQLIHDMDGIIESPNFPDPYPPLTDCLWDIQGGRDSKISLAFSHLAVEQRDKKCDYDFVKIFDMQDDVEISQQYLCQRPSDVITTVGNRLRLRFVSDVSEQRGGFRAEFKRIGCGATITDNFGSFASPNDPYSVNMECAWNIEVEVGMQITLHFTALQMDTGMNYDCNRDSIRVTEERNSVQTLFEECHLKEQMPVTITSPANRVYVRFITSDKRSRKFFRANFDAKEARCGGLLRVNRGTITSPNYPNEFATDMECEWNIRTENSYNLKILIEHWELQSGQITPYCNDAYVGIKIPDTTVEEQRFCRPLAQAIEIDGNMADISFHVSPEAHAKFSIRFVKSCSRTISDATGYLKSELEEVCSWTIEATKGSHININILHLECNCDENTNCTANGVSIYPNLLPGNDNASVNSSFCANHQTNLALPVNVVRITASNVNFRAKYSTIETACGGTLTSLQGYLVSPYYPATYPADVECSWLIEATRGNTIELNFDEFDIAASEHCNGDYLEIRVSEFGPLLGLYCGQQSPNDMLVGFERLWIKFRSMEGSTGNGFKLRWNYAHDNELESTEGKGVIQAPVAAAREQEEAYSWRIMVPHGQFIKAQFLEYSSGLEFYDGFDSGALKINILGSPWDFLSSSNVLYLITVNAKLEHFKLLWDVVSSRNSTDNDTVNECHEIINMPSSGLRSIKSPGYPNGYANNLDCSWEVNPVVPTLHITLSLYNVDLEDSVDCSLDYVRISTSTELQASWNEELTICKLASTDNMPIVVHGTPFLRVDFRTDSTVNKTGFRALARLSCGSNMTSTYGTILDKHMFMGLTADGICVWHIAVRPGKRISFDFQYNANTKNRTDCLQYAIIYDGIDMSAPILPPGKICNRARNNATIFETSTNKAVLKYNVTRARQLPNLWNLTFREINDCNDELRLTDIITAINISSPRYPDVPQPHTECTWTIIGPIGETLQVNFVDRFDLNRRYCNEEFVEMFDGSTMMARSLGRYCIRPRETISTTGNILHMHFLTNIAEPRTGFRATVSKGVCGGTFASDYGYISSKNYPAIGAYPRMTTCYYTIKVHKNFRIRLNFSDIHLPYDTEHPETSDSLEITLQTTEISDAFHPITYFGNITEMPLLESENNVVLIRFRTFQKGLKYRGFKLRFERISGICYREVTGESGILTLGNNIPTRSVMVCRWKITVPKGQRVRLELLNVERDLRNATAMDLHDASKFTFFNDRWMQSIISEFYLNEYNSSLAVIQSTDNFMSARLQTRLGSLKVKARYSSNEDTVCPPDVDDSATGVININTLRSYKSFYCDLHFTVADVQTITFKIKELTMIHTEPEGRQTAPIRFTDELSFMSYNALKTNVSDIFVSLSPRNGMLSLLQNDDVRIISFEANYKRHACGGYIVQLDNAFELNNPNIVDVSLPYGQLECVWNLKTETPPFKLTGNASFADTCDREYIVIYAGSTPKTAERQRICRDSATTNIEIILATPLSLVIYHTEDFRPGHSSFHFEAENIVDCATTTTVNRLSTMVTIDGSLYKNNMECLWEYQTSVGMYLSVLFSGRFFVEKSVNCSKDYVEVQRLLGGLWLPEARFCGRDVPSEFKSSSNHIQVLFRTDDAITGEGFRYQISSSCNRDFNVSKELQSIESPLLLDRRNINCEYIFHAGANDIISVQIRNKIPITDPVSNIARRTCHAASFTAYKTDDRGEMINSGKLCIGDDVRAKHYLKLKYSAYIDITFSLDYIVSSCGGNITATTAVISSVKDVSSDDYAHDMSCVWYVNAPADHSVLVRFKYFDLEFHERCINDFVAIYAGAMIDNNQVSKLCGNMTNNPPTILIDTNRAVITAISDYSVAHRGFLASIIFTRNCNERISLNEGNTPVTLARPLDIKEELFCNYNIMAPQNYRVRVQFKELQLNTATTNCSADCANCNHFTVVDSISVKETVIGEYCINNGSAIEVISSFEDILLQLRGSLLGQFRFEIVLQIEPTICATNTDMTLQPQQYINIIFPPTSNDTLYPPNTHCRWRIRSDSDFQLVFQFLSLQKRTQLYEKCLDYVQVQYATIMSTYFCGEAKNFTVDIPVFASKDAVDITFHSDGEYEDKGFHIVAMNRNYCNRTYSELSGNIQYSSFGAPATDCYDEIHIAENYSLIFQALNVVFSQENSSLAFFIILDINTNKTILQPTDHIYNMGAILTNTNAVRISASHYLDIRFFYYAQHKQSPPGCGGVSHSFSGQISSPSYNNDRNYSICRWNISVPEPNRIRITFSEFDMGVIAKCSLNKVELLEVLPNGIEMLTNSLCGSNLPSDFVSRSSRVAIVSHKSPNFDGVGWSLYYSLYDDADRDNRFTHLRT